jgi:hypothetical protein
MRLSASVASARREPLSTSMIVVIGCTSSADDVPTAVWPVLEQIGRRLADLGLLSALAGFREGAVVFLRATYNVSARICGRDNEFG